MEKLYLGREIHRDDIQLINTAVRHGADKYSFEPLDIPPVFATPIIGSDLLRSIVRSKLAQPESMTTLQEVLNDPVFTSPTGASVDVITQRGIKKELPSRHDARIAYELTTKYPSVQLPQVTKYVLQLAYNPRTRDKTDWLVRCATQKLPFSGNFAKPKPIDIGWTIDTNPEKRAKETRELLELIRDAVPHIRLGILAPLSLPN